MHGEHVLTTESKAPNDALAVSHHARFITSDVPLHVISRIFQGRHLLRPGPELNAIIVGVIGRAQSLYPEVRLYAVAFLSNHAHLMLQGPPDQVPAFIGFIKREISRRWGGHPDVDWPGTMWHEYLATALPTPASQVRCLKYVLSQGVKEGLVARPQDWPGVHCAKPLLLGRPLKGQWLNATAYSRALNTEQRRLKPRPVLRDDHITEYELRLHPILPWQDLDQAEYKQRVHVLVDEIQAETRQGRPHRHPIGIAAVCATPLERRTHLQPQPWFEDRRRLICWSDPQADETRAYLERYWAFQAAFRACVLAEPHAPLSSYPPGSFAPVRFVPIDHRRAA